jgi:hypothetical protein
LTANLKKIQKRKAFAFLVCNKLKTSLDKLKIMKNSSIIDQLNLLSEKSRKLAEKINKKTQLGITSLAIVLISAAILGGFSQVVEIPADAKEIQLPLEKTLTDSKGRELAGTILEKTENGIMFQRSTDLKKFEINKQLLSTKDQLLVEKLVNKKPSILLVQSVGNAPRESNKDLIESFEKLGFEITIGNVMDKSNTHPKDLDLRDQVYKGRDYIYLYPIDKIDNYDVVWIYEMSWEKDDKEFSMAAIVRRRNKNGEMILIASNSTSKSSKNYEKCGNLSNRYDMEKNFVKDHEKHAITYKIHGKDGDKVEFKEKLLKAFSEKFEKRFKR